MTHHTKQDITMLVRQARDGTSSDRDELYNAVYDTLKGLARGIPGMRPDSETIGPTALTHELFLEFERRFPAPPADMPESRRTFFQSVGLAMRTILRDHARAKRALKRGGGRARLSINETLDAGPQAAVPDAETLLAIDDAIERLEAFNARWAEVVMHRFYAGRSIAETARLMQRSDSSTTRDWALARAWLKREIGGAESDREASDG